MMAAPIAPCDQFTKAARKLSVQLVDQFANTRQRGDDYDTQFYALADIVDQQVLFLLPAHPYNAPRRDMVRELTFDLAMQRYGFNFELFGEDDMPDPITLRMRRLWLEAEVLKKERNLTDSDALAEAIAEALPAVVDSTPVLLQRQAG